MVFKIDRRSLLGGVAASVAVGSSPVSAQDVRREVFIGLASDEGPNSFIRHARRLGGVEAVTVYTTPDKGRLEYERFPRELKRITLVMKFLPSTYGSDIFKQIIAGRCDAHLRQFADRVIADGRRIILRPFHEYNLGPFHTWSVYASGNNPDDFIPAWRHVVSLLRGLTDLIEFDLNPNRESFIALGKYPRGGPTSDFARFYPGDQWVDWVSISSYNRGFLTKGDRKVHSFSEDFRPAYQAMKKIVRPGMPFAISETSTTSRGGVNKGEWFGAMLHDVATEFTDIGIINLFLISKKNPGEELADWALHGHTEYEMLKRVLGEFRTRMGMPTPPLFN